MKAKLLLILIGILPLLSLAQQTISGTSQKGYVNITKDPPKPPYLEIVQSSITFSDSDGNNKIDAGETAYIRFKLTNTGLGPGLDLKISTKLTSIAYGITFSNFISAGTLDPGKEKILEIPLNGTMEIKDGSATFEIRIDEANGFDSDPVQLEVETRSFRAPNVIIADYKVTSQSGTTLQKRKPFDLQILLQNIGQGPANNVKVSLPLSNGLFCLSANEVQVIGTLEPGESKLLEYNLVTNAEYTSSTLPFNFDLAEKYGKYAVDKTITLALNQNVSSEKMAITGKEEQPVNITTGSLTSVVDRNIPVATIKHPNRYALIIGNEKYSTYGSVSAEVDVEFARNDAQVFAEYAGKTFGIDQKNIFLLQDVTAAVMRLELNRFSKLVALKGTEAEIIFYYAGHGYPDEVSQIPYLMPIDVNATNINDALKLSDVYQKLALTGAGKIIVFLDACFSGGGRNQGLLAARGAVIDPKEEEITGNMVVFSATSGTQSALPLSKEKHGLFTFYTLKKLQETSGNLTYGELSDYLKKEVPAEALYENRKEQMPEVNVSSKVEGVWRNWTVK